MKKTTQKQLKYLVSIGAAQNANNMDTKEAEKLRPVERMSISHGINGANGLLFRGVDGNLYAVTARCSNLFYFL